MSFKRRFGSVQKLLLIYAVMLAVVVVPFVFFGDWFDTVAAQLLSGERKFEMFLVTSGLLAADVFIPVPSSAVSVSAGMLLGLPLAFLATLLGLTLGCYIGYGFGFYFRKVHFDRWNEDSEFRKLSAEFSRHGYIVLLTCRSIPLLSEMSVIVAGFHRYPLAKFTVVTFAANSVLAGLYAFLGDNAMGLNSVYLVVAIMFCIPFFTYSARLLWVSRASSARHT